MPVKAMKKTNPLYTHKLQKLSNMFSQKEIIVSCLAALGIIAGASVWNSNVLYALPAVFVLFLWFKR